MSGVPGFGAASFVRPEDFAVSITDRDYVLAVGSTGKDQSFRVRRSQHHGCGTKRVEGTQELGRFVAQRYAGRGPRTWGRTAACVRTVPTWPPRLRPHARKSRGGGPCRSGTRQASEKNENSVQDSTTRAERSLRQCTTVPSALNKTVCDLGSKDARGHPLLLTQWVLLTAVVALNVSFRPT